MTRMTQSFAEWCLKFHPQIYIPLRFGHTESLTEDLYQEYLKWVESKETSQNGR